MKCPECGKKLINNRTDNYRKEERVYEVVESWRWMEDCPDNHGTLILWLEETEAWDGDEQLNGIQEIMAREWRVKND